MDGQTRFVTLLGSMCCAFFSLSAVAGAGEENAGQLKSGMTVVQAVPGGALRLGC